MDSFNNFAIPSIPASRLRPQPAPQAPAKQEKGKEKEQPQETPVKAPATPRAPPLAYEKPSWSALPSFNYQIEVLKNGASVETIKGPKKEYVTIGRLPLCDILMEHPSISRYQAVIQFDHDGDAYLFDLNSAHGTLLNKKPVPPREHVPLRPGDQIRFGESTRLCIFDSQKPYDPEAEAAERRERALKERIAKARGQPEPEEVDQGISWGFAEDAQEEEEEEEEEENENTIEDIKASLNQSSRDADLLSVEAQKQAFEDAKRRREDIELIKEKQVAIQIEQISKQIQEKQQEKQGEEEQDLDAYMSQLSKKQNKSLALLQKELGQLKKDHERLVKLVKLTKPTTLF
ncbi:SMAD/FHA domain-containing protein [Blakeslea trispora]|nr:SMAD/FHA domain-containing protein [Blakeslea trispora]